MTLLSHIEAQFKTWLNIERILYSNSSDLTFLFRAYCPEWASSNASVYKCLCVSIFARMFFSKHKIKGTKKTSQEAIRPPCGED